jgi:hypothetical protein
MKSNSVDKNKTNFHIFPNKVKRSSSVSTSRAKEIFKNFKKLSRASLKQKHQTNKHSLNVKIINDIIYNERAHIVSKFKDYLILDDTSDFLRRFYKASENKQKLNSLFEFYESYSKIFPNYIVIPESKYLYKNIQRKQKMIDNIQKMQNERERTEHDKMDDYIFNTEIYNSIMNQTTGFEDKNSTKLQLKPYIEGKNSFDSIEVLIDSIGKAEGVGKNSLEDHLNTINSISDNIQSKKAPEIQEKTTNHNKNSCLSPSLNSGNFIQKLNSNVISQTLKIKTEKIQKSPNNFIYNKTETLKNLNINLLSLQSLNTLKDKVQVSETIKNIPHLKIKAIKKDDTGHGKIISAGELSDRTERNDRNRLAVQGINLNSMKPLIINQTERQSTSQSKYGTGNSKFHKQTNSMPKLPLNGKFNFNNYGSVMTHDLDRNFLSSLNSIHSHREVSPWQKKEKKSLTSAKPNSTSRITEKIERYYKNDLAKIKKKVIHLVNETNQKKNHKKNLLSSESNLMAKYTSNTNTINLTNLNAYNNSTTNLGKAEVPLSSRVNNNYDNSSIRAKLHKDLFEKETKIETTAKKQLVENTKVRI